MTGEWNVPDPEAMKAATALVDALNETENEKLRAQLREKDALLGRCRGVLESAKPFFEHCDTGDCESPRMVSEDGDLERCGACSSERRSCVMGLGLTYTLSEADLVLAYSTAWRQKPVPYGSAERWLTPAPPLVPAPRREP